MSVSAIDADDPMTENAALSYSIVSQESIPANAVTKTMFGINNQTGAIYTRDVGLDREVGLTRVSADSRGFLLFKKRAVFSRRWCRALS